MTTDKAGPYPRIINDLVRPQPTSPSSTATTRIEADHARLKARLRPMRGLKQFRSAERIAAGHTFVQNLRRGHYEIATDVSPPLRLVIAFTELAQAI